MNERVLLAGDTHGNLRAVKAALDEAVERQCAEVIQLGDFGFGWDEDFVPAVSRLCVEREVPVLWIDGNHENFDLLEAFGAFDASDPTEIAPLVTYLPRGTVLERAGKRLLCIGGAYSVDKSHRTPHVSWWEQEEIRHADIERALSAADGGVDVVLSHDVPDVAFRHALGQWEGRTRGNPLHRDELDHLAAKNDERFPGARPNRMALQGIFDALDPKPEAWVHGHYHGHYEAMVKGCRFVGLNLETSRDSRLVLDLTELARVSSGS